MITWQVGADSDDVYRRLAADFFNLANTNLAAGAVNDVTKQYGCGMRFTNITIPKGATIENGTHLTITADADNAGTIANTRISAEDVNDAVTFADNAAAFDARWAARTAAIIDWDGIAAWVKDTEYNSPEIKTVIQEIVDRDGWASGNDIVIFWEDFADRSLFAVGLPIRVGYAHAGTPAKAPKLVIGYTPPTVGRSYGFIIG